MQSTAVTQTPVTPYRPGAPLCRQRWANTGAMQELRVLRHAIDAARAEPTKIELWDAAGRIRERVRRHCQAMALLQRYGVNLDLDLDQLQQRLNLIA